MRWDPAQYAQFSGQRDRPFFELVARIDADSPAAVVDLGCGSGQLTGSLAARWPTAAIRGIDSSAEMIERAVAGRTVSFAIGAAQDFDASATDVLVSNALLQWVPGHRQLLAGWAAQLNPDGWLAFQVPDNFAAPSHRLMRELAESDAWRGALTGVLRTSDAVARPAEYLELLTAQGLLTDVWQTEYLHVLTGPDPVLEWVRGTALRPVLAVLSTEAAADFEVEYASLLRKAYRTGVAGTVFPFRRTFVVAHKP